MSGGCQLEFLTRALFTPKLALPVECPLALVEEIATLSYNYAVILYIVVLYFLCVKFGFYYQLLPTKILPSQ